MEPSSVMDYQEGYREGYQIGYQQGAEDGRSQGYWDAKMRVKIALETLGVDTEVMDHVQTVVGDFD